MHSTYLRGDRAAVRQHLTEMGDEENFGGYNTGAPSTDIDSEPRPSYSGIAAPPPTPIVDIGAELAGILAGLGYLARLAARARAERLCATLARRLRRR